jgi:sigma-B regulation protein RsbU (phosphoserine phosphatase)
VISGLSDEAWRAVVQAGDLLRLGPGEVVLRPGEPNQALHFVLEGCVEVRLEETSALVSRVPTGECFGEMSVIDGQPASAWVVAAGPCELLRVPAERVWADLMPRPGFARALLRLLSGRLRQTLERQTAWEQVRKELRLAREIQSSMLPSAGAIFPDRPIVDCASVMEPAAEVGGDFYDAFFLDEHRLFFAVGDVAGKGIGAALFMARSMTLLRAEALRRRSLQDVLGRVNEALAAGNEQATFVSLFCGVFDCGNGILRYGNGGVAAPFIRCGGRWSRLAMPRGIVVGAIPGFVFESGRARLAPGDEIVVFSDGVTEATNVAGELFGEPRLRSVLEGSGPLSAVARVGLIRAAVREFEAGRHPADDLTLFVLGRPVEEGRARKSLRGRSAPAAGSRNRRDAPEQRANDRFQGASGALRPFHARRRAGPEGPGPSEPATPSGSLDPR